MKSRWLWFTLAAAILPHAVAAATDGTASSPVTLGNSSLALPLASVAPANVACEPDSKSASSSASTAEFSSTNTVFAAQFSRAPGSFESIRYRPRRGRYYPPRDYPPRDDTNRDVARSNNRATGFSQLHGGFFDPSGDDANNAFVFGFRGGSNLDDKVQLGLGLDWQHRTDRNTAVVSEEPLPGGGTSERRLELSESSSNLFPIMAFIQLSPAGDLPVIPYFGVGGGYEVLFLNAQNFETGEKFDGTFGGWGWQAWGGAALPLSGNTRLAAEVFTNTATLERDVDDPSGATFHEVVDLDGLGMRFGVNWGF